MKLRKNIKVSSKVTHTNCKYVEMVEMIKPEKLQYQHVRGKNELTQAITL